MNFTLESTFTILLIGCAVIPGIGLTVTVTVFVFVQPDLFFPVIVYIVVAAGLAVTLDPKVVFNPAAGLQEKVSAPLAMIETEPPSQNDGATGNVVIAGKGLTVTVTVFDVWQPKEFVPVMVYIVVTDGFAITVAPVVEFSPV